MGKVIKLTESQLKKVIKSVVEEQNAPIKNRIIKIVTPESNAQAVIKLQGGKKVLTVTTESGQTQSIYVRTNLPVGDVLFLMGKDGKSMFGYSDKQKKYVPIFPL